MDLLREDENSVGVTRNIVTKTNFPNADFKILNNSQESIKKIEALKYTLERNFMVDETHNTPLHYAAKLGDLKLASNLLKNGVFIMTINSDYNTPLHEAFIHGQEEIVDLILNFMEQTLNFLNLKNSQGLTHLHIATTRKSRQIVENFIADGANVKDVVNKDSPYYAGYTVLQFAVEFKSIEVLEILISICKINDYDKNSLKAVRQQYTFRTVITAAIELHHNTDAKFKYTNLNRLTDFQWACFKAETDVVRNLLAEGEDGDTATNRKAIFCPSYTPLHFAVKANKKETVKLLTQYGADIEKRNGYFMTPLHLAFYYEDYKEKDTIVDHLYNILVNKKANLMDLNGLTYFHIAVSRNDLIWVRKLLDQGEDVNSPILCNHRNFSFYMPLHFAVRFGHLQMAQLLIERGAKINGNEDRRGDTPLHVASEVGCINLIDLLLKNGANVKAKRLVDGKTALHLLIESYLNICKNNGKKDEVIKYIGRLVRSGCDVNDKDIEENTALHIACSKFPFGTKCVEALIAHGADVNIEDELGQTPPSCTFYFSYRENGEDYLKLYNHVQNLKALGMEINLKNDRFCDILMETKSKWDKNDMYNEEVMLQKHQQRLSEIQSMKSLKLAEDLSLYDFMILSPEAASDYVMSDILKYVILDTELQNYYPFYSYLILMQYRRAVITLKLKYTIKKSVIQEISEN